MDDTGAVHWPRSYRGPGGGSSAQEGQHRDADDDGSFVTAHVRSFSYVPVTRHGEARRT